jgi:hypothetical protein
MIGVALRLLALCALSMANDLAQAIHALTTQPPTATPTTFRDPLAQIMTVQNAAVTNSTTIFTAVSLGTPFTRRIGVTDAPDYFSYRLTDEKNYGSEYFISFFQ